MLWQSIVCCVNSNIGSCNVADRDGSSMESFIIMVSIQTTSDVGSDIVTTAGRMNLEAEKGGLWCLYFYTRRSARQSQNMGCPRFSILQYKRLYDNHSGTVVDFRLSLTELPSDISARISASTSLISFDCKSPLSLLNATRTTSRWCTL
jgi:hypothetical protein